MTHKRKLYDTKSDNIKKLIMKAKLLIIAIIFISANNLLAQTDNTGPQSKKLADTGFEYEDGMFSEAIDDAQLMEFKYLRFHETVLKNIQD